MSTDNSTSASGGGGSNITLEFIGIAVFVGIALYFLISYAHNGFADRRGRRAGAGGGGHAGASPPRLGLAPSDIAALPTFVFPEATNSSDGGGEGAKGKGNGMVACPVCLADVEEGEVVRMLPSCKHFFHVQCIDVWLCSHMSCPVCRAPTEAERVRLGAAMASPPQPGRRTSTESYSEAPAEERPAGEEAAPPSPDRLARLRRGGATETSVAIGEAGPETVGSSGPAVSLPSPRLRRCRTAGSSAAVDGKGGPEGDEVKLDRASASPALPSLELRRCSTAGSLRGNGRGVVVGELEKRERE